MSNAGSLIFAGSALGYLIVAVAVFCWPPEPRKPQKPEPGGSDGTWGAELALAPDEMPNTTP